MSTLSFSSPIGALGLNIQNGKLTHIEFFSEKTAEQKPTHPIAQELRNYFANPHHVFEVPLELKGTEFQKKVWHALTQIPAGTTVSYNTLAKQLKTSPRAVGNACRANPIPVIIPCHRVVAQSHLGGYAGQKAGDLMEIKKWLLQHEQSL